MYLDLASGKHVSKIPGHEIMVCLAHSRAQQNVAISVRDRNLHQSHPPTAINGLAGFKSLGPAAICIAKFQKSIPERRKRPVGLQHPPIFEWHQKLSLRCDFDVSWIHDVNIP